MPSCKRRHHTAPWQKFIRRTLSGKHVGSIASSYCKSRVYNVGRSKPRGLIKLGKFIQRQFQTVLRKGVHALKCRRFVKKNPGVFGKPREKTDRPTVLCADTCFCARLPFLLPPPPAVAAAGSVDGWLPPSAPTCAHSWPRPMKTRFGSMPGGDQIV